MRFDSEAHRRVVGEINRLWSQIVGRPPRFRYFKVGNDHYAFAWTTERAKDGKFYALKYRITKTTWKLVHKVSFGRRKIAKARALKWYNERKASLETQKGEA